MRDEPATELESSDARWHPAVVGPPRHVKGERYEMIVEREGRHETIASGVTIAQALVIALARPEGCSAGMFYRDRGAFLEYVIGRRRSEGDTFEPMLRGVVPRSAGIRTDHVPALEFFEELFKDDPHVFFDGWLKKISSARARRAATGGGRA